jgi:predicted HAD superfamily Cof-like phosphohydrolase
MLRVKLIAEELLELCDALGLSLEIELGGDVNIRSTGAEPRLDLAADATGDLKVVVIGTDVAMGIDGQPVWDEIMASNFTKFIDGFRREDGKWMKGKSYRPPNLAPILEQQMKG